MGGYFSQENSPVYEDCAGRPNETHMDFTPSQRLRHMRLLALDPRSPSQFIDRTPIFVNKTPDIPDDKLRCSQAVTETTHADPIIKDPRSPTSEFTRTPINPCHPSSATTRHRIPVTPTSIRSGDMPSDLEESVNDSPVILFGTELSGDPTTSLESLESAIGSDQVSPSSSEKATSPCIAESSQDVVDASPLDVDDTGCDEDDEGYEDMDVFAVVLENKAIQRVKSIEESTPKIPVVTRSISHNRIGMKPKLLSLAPVVTRSPLSTVVNSPRVLQQGNILPARGRKHIQGLNMLHDKENIHH